MTTPSSETVLQILRQYDRQEHVQPSPRQGHIRIFDNNNDVTCAIEKMGGVEAAAQTLGVSTTELDRWIDEHYVPEPYASAVNKYTCYSIWSIQQPTFYVFDGSDYWPHAPTQEELKRPIRISIYRRRLTHSTTSGQAW